MRIPREMSTLIISHTASHFFSPSYAMVYQMLLFPLRAKLRLIECDKIVSERPGVPPRSQCIHKKHRGDDMVGKCSVRSRELRAARNEIEGSMKLFLYAS